MSGQSHGKIEWNKFKIAETGFFIIMTQVLIRIIEAILTKDFRHEEKE